MGWQNSLKKIQQINKIQMTLIYVELDTDIGE